MRRSRCALNSESSLRNDKSRKSPAFFTLFYIMLPRQKSVQSLPSA